VSAATNKKKSERILAEVTRRQKQDKIVDVDEKNIKLVIFSLVGDYYAFPGEDIKEILPWEQSTYVPGSPDVILGIINVRGEIESVFNIHKFLGFSDAEPTRSSRIVIANTKSIRSGVLVDSVEDVADVPENAIKPPVATLHPSIQDFVMGETIHNNRNVTLLNVEKILANLAV